MTDASLPGAGVERRWNSWRRARRRVAREPGSRAAVHDFRVATRRLLAVAALLQPAGAAHDGASCASLLEAVMHAAGRLRNRQLSQRELRALRARYPAASDIAATIRARLPRDEGRLVRELERCKERRVGECCAALLPAANQVRSAERASARARRRVARAQRRVLRLVGRLPPQPSAKSLHELRLEVKQLRYMSEWLAEVGSSGEGGEARAAPAWSLPALVSLQRALGAVADARVLIEAVAGWAGKSARRAERSAVLRAMLARRQQRAVAAAVRQLRRQVER